MESQLASMKPPERAKFTHVNNYYNRRIQHRPYPPDIRARGKKRFTKEDFGREIAKWREWLEELEEDMNEENADKKDNE